MEKTILFILLLGFVSLVIYPLQTFASEDITKSSPVKYILISSKDFSHVNDILRKSIKTLLPNVQETYFEHNSSEAEKYIKELDVKFVPFVIYDNSVATVEVFFHMVQHKMVEKVKGYYVIPVEQLKMGEIMFLEREREPNKLHIFVMSFCRYSKEAEARIINFIRKNDLDIDIQVKYLVSLNEFGITSTHGPAEIKENVRQIAIQKHYPDKFLDYLLLIQNKNTEEALKELGISLEVIDSKREEALKILAENFKESESLGIKRSLTFLWENIYLIPNLDGLKQHKPFNIKKARKASAEKILSGPIDIEFFYSEGCRACHKIKEDFIPEIKSKYKDKIVIKYHNIADAEEFRLKLALEKNTGY